MARPTLLPSLRIAICCGLVLAASTVTANPQTGSVAPAKTGGNPAAGAGGWPNGTPPLYRRLRSLPMPAGSGTSMIAAIGDLQHSPVLVQRDSPQRLSFAVACASSPTPEQLRAFGSFEWMTEEQASALGVRFRPVTPGGAIPAPAWALVWRSGRVAKCAAAEGSSTLVYGAEWDLALLVVSPRPAKTIRSLDDLRAALSARDIVAVGSSPGDREAQEKGLPEALGEILHSLQNSRSGPLSTAFLQAFERMRLLGSTAAEPAEPLKPIGVL